jgi:hypothetical protein
MSLCENSGCNTKIHPARHIPVMGFGPFSCPASLPPAQFALGDFSQAFAWLEKVYEERSVTLILLKVDPMLDPLRSDPRYQDLLRRMNFPP